MVILLLTAREWVGGHDKGRVQEIRRQDNQRTERPPPNAGEASTA
jgi:hypothetical protein